MSRHLFVARHTEATLSQQLFQEVNAYRRSRGAAQLPRHAGLDQLAREHSEYLRKHRGTFSLYGKNVSHIGADKRARVAWLLYQMDTCSENVAFTFNRGSEAQTAKAVAQLWQNSANHEVAMADPTWTDTGVGTVVDKDGAVFATQIFGVRRNFQMVGKTPPTPTTNFR